MLLCQFYLCTCPVCHGINQLLELLLCGNDRAPWEVTWNAVVSNGPCDGPVGTINVVPRVQQMEVEADYIYIPSSGGNSSSVVMGSSSGC